MKQSKIIVIGSDIKAQIIKGICRIGNKVVLTHKGKVKHGIVVRTKSYNQFNVSFDNASVVILGETTRIRGPISKGVIEEIKSLASMSI